MWKVKFNKHSETEKEFYIKSDIFPHIMSTSVPSNKVVFFWNLRNHFFINQFIHFVPWICIQRPISFYSNSTMYNKFYMKSSHGETD